MAMKYSCNRNKFVDFYKIDSKFDKIITKIQKNIKIIFMFLFTENFL